MIKKFFHDLNSFGVSYMLISGQATVLYGAATFSEDIDIWVEPRTENWKRFLKVINGIGARIYKLTPPISMELIKKGHGYHFQIPVKDGKPPFWFLDVMGVVPRVGDFKKAFKNTTYQKTDWGKLPVIGIRDLVEIKKTRRLEDYPVISNLARIEYENLSSKRINTNDWKWILTNSFEIEDILYYLNSYRLARSTSATLPRTYLSFCIKAISNQKKKEEYLESASRAIALEIEDLRRQDRKYWEPVISELKSIKEKKGLLTLGSKPQVSLRQ